MNGFHWSVVGAMTMSLFVGGCASDASEADEVVGRTADELVNRTKNESYSYTQPSTHPCTGAPGTSVRGGVGGNYEEHGRFTATSSSGTVITGKVRYIFHVDAAGNTSANIVDIDLTGC